MEIQKLEIRRLREDEIGSALKLVWEVFEREIKPSYSEEGVQEFLKFIDYGFMKELFDKGEMIFWGAFEEELIGTVAVRKDGHISLFFVKNEYQGIGVGKALFQMMYNHLVQELNVEKITVNATPQAVAKYIHMGMRQIGNMEERKGIRSVPMEMMASKDLIKPVCFGEKKKTKTKKGWIIGIAILLVVLGGLIFCGVRLIQNVIEFTIEDEYVREFPDETLGEDYLSEATGVDAIPVYKEEHLLYKMENESYDFIDDEKLNTIIEFGVQYPQISVDDSMFGKNKYDKEVLEKVNEAIRNVAMETVEEIYNQPSVEIKETVLQAELPVLVSYVNYKVTYASEDFVSIVMEDEGYRGSEEAYYYDFKTLNISLQDGTIYEVKDIVEIDSVFVKDWLAVMRQEADVDDFLSELNRKELKKALEGESFDGVYEVEFFFDEEGIEIGFSFDYEENDPDNKGYAWVTAPFSFDKMENYKSDSAIWSEIN